MTITLEQYFRGRPHSPVQEEAALELLAKVNCLLDEFRLSGGEVPINPHTNSMISGLTEGGFRLPDCVQGSKFSSHKEAKGVDITDPKNELDAWITRKVLEKYNLYREAEQYTQKWVHLQTRVPKSGCRSFLP